MNELAAKTHILHSAYLERYSANSHPRVAADYAVADFFNRFKNDKYLEQLLDEQIEDVQKAIKQAKAA